MVIMSSDVFPKLYSGLLTRHEYSVRLSHLSHDLDLFNC